MKNKNLFSVNNLNFLLCFKDNLFNCFVFCFLAHFLLTLWLTQQKTWISNSSLIAQSFDGTVVNRALPSLYGWSFEITLTIPLMILTLGTV